MGCTPNERQTMTLTEAQDYVDTSHEIESEARAEYGMGATSLGYDAAEWAPAFDGYRAADDPAYAEAARIIAAHAPAPVAVAAVDTSDDLPF